MSDEIKQELHPDQSDLKRTIERINAFAVADGTLWPETAFRAVRIAKLAFDVGMITQSVFFSEGEIELSFYFGKTCDITLHITNKVTTRVVLCAAQCQAPLESCVSLKEMSDGEVSNLLKYLMAFKAEDSKP